MVVSVETIVALQVEGDVIDIGLLKIDDPHELVDVTGIVEPLAQIPRFTCSTQSRARLLRAIEATEPRCIADDENALGDDRLITAPLRPAFGWTTGMRVPVELIQHHLDPAAAHSLGKRADAQALRVIELAIADEDLGHGRRRGLARAVLVCPETR